MIENDDSGPPLSLHHRTVRRGLSCNRAYYFANRITPGENFLPGADYLYWLTEGLQRGVDQRMNIFLQYNF